MVKAIVFLVLAALVLQFVWYSICTVRLIQFFRNQTPPHAPVNEVIARVAPLPTLKNYRDSLIFFVSALTVFLAVDFFSGGELATHPSVIIGTLLFGFVAVSTGLHMRLKEYQLRRRQLTGDAMIFQASNLTPATLKKSGAATNLWMPGFHCANLQTGKQAWLPYDIGNSKSELKGFVFKFPKAGFWWNFRPRLGFISEEDLRELQITHKSA